MKRLFLFLITLSIGYSCGPKMYGIKRKKVIPEEDVRVIMDPKIIITGYKGEDNKNSKVDIFGINIKNTKKKDEDIKMRPIKAVNNEKTSFEFYIPPGEQEINITSRYTRGSWSYTSNESSLTINGKSGDVIFICTKVNEVGNKRPTGGIVRSVIEPQLIYLKEYEKEMAFRKDDAKKNPIHKKIDPAYFKRKCNALIYGISE